MVYWVHIVSGCILGELFVWFNPTSPTSGSISLTPYYSQLMVGFLWFSLVELDVNEKMKSVIHVALQPFFLLSFGGADSLKLLSIFPELLSGTTLIRI